MAETKLFAGPRVRRIRMGLELTQTRMAKELGISPSYLNLIERNQRPLTVQLVLKLASTYQIDVGELQAGADGGSVAALKEVFADPLLESELPGDTELVEFSDGAPNAAAGIVKLYRAFKEQQERLSDVSKLLGEQGKATAGAGRLPIDAVRDAFETNAFCFPLLEEAAGRLLDRLDTDDDLYETMKLYFRKERGISVQSLPAETMPLWRKRFDRHSQRLFISERLSRSERCEVLAQEFVLIHEADAIDEETEFLKLAGIDEAARLARLELARYTALAMMMPYQRILQAAERTRYDIEVIAARFGVSFLQAAHRVVALQDNSRGNRAGLPFFLMETDQAGNTLRRLGARGFPSARFGGECPKLAVYACFATPGEMRIEKAVTPDEDEFLIVAQTVDGPSAGFEEQPRRVAVLLGVDIGNAEGVVYSDRLPGGPDAGGISIGPSCRLCERQGCLSRAHPPLTRPLGLDPWVQGIGAFDFT